MVLTFLLWYFCSCLYWVLLPSIKVHLTILEATAVVVVNVLVVALLVVADQIIATLGSNCNFSLS